MEDLKPHADVLSSFPFVDYSEDNAILYPDHPHGDKPMLYTHLS